MLMVHSIRAIAPKRRKYLGHKPHGGMVVTQRVLNELWTKVGLLISSTLTNVHTCERLRQQTIGYKLWLPKFYQADNWVFLE